MVRRPIPLLFLLLLLLPLPLRAAPTRQDEVEVVIEPANAAPTRQDHLEVVVEPPYAAPGQTVEVIVKNFHWSQVARLNVSLLNLSDPGPEQSLTPDAPLKLGPRRRAALAAAPAEPGAWTAQPTGDWIFGGPVSAPTGTVIITTPGSSAGAIGPNESVEGALVPGADGNGVGAWVLDLAEETPVAFRINWRDADGDDSLSLIDSAGEELASHQTYISTLTLPRGRYFVVPHGAGEQAYTLTLSPGLSGDAEDGATLSPGAIFAGLLAPRQDTDDFTFAAAPGDVVYLALSAATGSLDPFLTLLDPIGNEVAANDDVQGYNAALAYVVPVAGNYTIRAASAGGNSEGEYTLELALDPQMARLRPPTAMTVGDRAGGATPQGGAQAWRFEGAAGQAVGILVERHDDSFDPLLTLYGPDGGQLEQVDDTNGSLNPLLNTELPDDGYYTIVVGSYTGAGGEYTLTLGAGSLPTPAP
jgi:hypothetical protein